MQQLVDERAVPAEVLWRRLGEHLAWVETLAEAYAGHEDNGERSTLHGRHGHYVRAGLPEVATALAALTGEPHPLAIKDPGTGPAGEYRY